MALVLADRVKETTTSTGTTAITLAGAPTGYQTFSAAIGNANTTYYTIVDQSGANWEVGIGTYTTSGNTLSRDTVLASSNSGSLVTFTSGTKDVFVTYPAEHALYSGGALGTPASGTLTNCTFPTLNQNTTGTAANVTGVVAIANGGTGLTSLGSGITTFLGAPSSANLAAAVTDETGSGSLVFATNPTLIGLKQTKVAMAANDVNLATGDYFTKTISTATTLTVSNVPTSGTVASFILDLTNGGSATITWWTVKWVGGTAPTLTAAGRDTLGFFTYDGGTTWTGLVLGKDIK